MSIGRLVFVGTVHVHPRGPDILESLLRAICQRLGEPAFVAVEGHEGAVAAAATARAEFERNLVAAGIATESAKELARIPLYEGWVVSQFCGADMPTIWLSDGGAVVGWENRLAGIVQRFEHEQQIGLLRSWSEGCLEAHAYEEFDEAARERETNLFERLRAGLAAYSDAGTYAIAVVGANHASRASNRVCGMCVGQLGLQISQAWCTERWLSEIDEWLEMSS
jgi:hypothetical protein